MKSCAQASPHPPPPPRNHCHLLAVNRTALISKLINNAGPRSWAVLGSQTVVQLHRESAGRGPRGRAGQGRKGRAPGLLHLFENSQMFKLTPNAGAAQPLSQDASLPLTTVSRPRPWHLNAIPWHDFCSITFSAVCWGGAAAICMLKIYCEKCARCSGEDFFFPSFSLCCLCVFCVSCRSSLCAWRMDGS